MPNTSGIVNNRFGVQTPISKELPSSERVRRAREIVNGRKGYRMPVLMTAAELALRHVELLEIDHDLSGYAEDELAETAWKEQGDYDQANQQDRWDGGAL